MNGGFVQEFETKRLCPVPRHTLLFVWRDGWKRQKVQIAVGALPATQQTSELWVLKYRFEWICR